VEVFPIHAAHFTLNLNGTFRYEHDGSEGFTDSFVYRVTDNDGEFTTATVNIAITPVSDASPSASDDAVVLSKGGVATILVGGADSVLANDTGLSDTPILLELDTPPQSHSLFVLNSDGTFVYEHDGGDTTSDFFVYRITDGDGQTSTARVSIAVIPPTVVRSISNDDRGVFDRLTSLAFQFSGDVVVQPTALTLLNATTARLIDLTLATFEYDAATRTGRWDLTALNLEKGLYQAGLSASEIVDAGGTPLDGNGDGVAGDDYRRVGPVAVTWSGDANLNLNVAFDDFVALAEFFGRLAQLAWDQGDFDGDHDVDFGDFVQLAENFGKSVDNPSLLALSRVGRASTVDSTSALLDDADQSTRARELLAVDTILSGAFGKGTE
jgi:hypothetical protein